MEHMIERVPFFHEAKRERLKAYLKDSMFWNKTLFENNKDALFALDLEGHFICLNPACMKISGYSDEEAAQLTFFELIKAYEHERVHKFFLQTLAGNVQDFDCSIVTKHGTNMDVHVTAIPISVNDEIVGIYGVARDITDIKLNRKRLQKEEELNRLLTEKSMDMIAKIDLNGDFLFVSPASQSILGYSPQELIGTPSLKLIYPEDVKRVLKIRETVLRGKSIERITCRFCKKDGSFIWMDIQYIPLLDDQTGTINEILSVSRDITKLKNYEAEILSNEETYRNLVEFSPDAIIISRNTKILFVNNATVHLVGAEKKEDLIGKSLFDFLKPEHYKMLSDKISEVHKGKPVEFIEQEFIRLDGSFFEAEVKVIPSIYKREFAAHTIVRDTTERKKTRELMLKSEKLSVAGQLAAGIAHEVRNPLTAIKGFIQLMKSNHKDEEKVYYDIIDSEIDRIEGILSELLALVKPKSVKLERKRLDNLLNQVIALTSTQAIMQNIVINKENENPLLEISCDENQLKQVFINFIKNSIEAMPNGGMISIDVKVHKPENKVRLTFNDQGNGIPEEVLKRVGEPFFTTKENGTGLGLMISKQIIEGHNGIIQISSKANGTTVDVSLPLE